MPACSLESMVDFDQPGSWGVVSRLLGNRWNFVARERERKLGAPRPQYILLPVTYKVLIIWLTDMRITMLRAGKVKKVNDMGAWEAITYFCVVIPGRAYSLSYDHRS